MDAAILHWVLRIRELEGIVQSRQSELRNHHERLKGLHQKLHGAADKQVRAYGKSTLLQATRLLTRVESQHSCKPLDYLHAPVPRGSWNAPL